MQKHYRYVILSWLWCVGKGFLSIRNAPLKGEGTFLVCAFPTTTVNNVEWLHDQTMQAICGEGSECHSSNGRYVPTVYNDRSELSIDNASYFEDEGDWSCVINGQFKSTRELVVHSLPSSFDLANRPTFIPVEGLKLEVRAVCVYPKGDNIILQYRIEGDSIFNDFQKEGRSVEYIYIEDWTNNCLSHEYIAIARTRLEIDDLVNVKIDFRFLYMDAGLEIPTKSTLTFLFSDQHNSQNISSPFGNIPCLNIGSCTNDSFKERACDCSSKFRWISCNKTGKLETKIYLDTTEDKTATYV